MAPLWVMCLCKNALIWWWSERKKSRSGLRTSVGWKRKQSMPVARSSPNSSPSKDLMIRWGKPISCARPSWTISRKINNKSMKDSSIISGACKTRRINPHLPSGKPLKRNLKRKRSWPLNLRSIQISGCRPTVASFPSQLTHGALASSVLPIKRNRSRVRSYRQNRQLGEAASSRITRLLPCKRKLLRLIVNSRLLLYPNQRPIFLH